MRSPLSLTRLHPGQSVNFARQTVRPLLTLALLLSAAQAWAGVIIFQSLRTVSSYVHRSIYDQWGGWYDVVDSHQASSSDEGFWYGDVRSQATEVNAEARASQVGSTGVYDPASGAFHAQMSSSIVATYGTAQTGNWWEGVSATADMLVGFEIDSPYTYSVRRKTTSIGQVTFQFQSSDSYAWTSTGWDEEAHGVFDPGYHFLYVAQIARTGDSTLRGNLDFHLSAYPVPPPEPPAVPEPGTLMLLSAGLLGLVVLPRRH